MTELGKVAGMALGLLMCYLIFLEKTTTLPEGANRPRSREPVILYNRY